MPLYWAQADDENWASDTLYADLSPKANIGRRKGKPHTNPIPDQPVDTSNQAWLAYLNKHCSKISQETLLNNVSNELLPFMVGQSYDSVTLLSVKDVM
jgi:hypothetical protein